MSSGDSSGSREDEGYGTTAVSGVFSVFSGDGQVGPVASPLPQPLTARLLDAGSLELAVGEASRIAAVGFDRGYSPDRRHRDIPDPPGRVVYFDEAFENTDFASRGWYDNTGMAVTTDEAHAGSSSLLVRFKAGATVPTWGNAARMEIPETESLYVRYWVKYSENWVGSERAYHPHEFYLLTNRDGRWTGPSTTYLTTYIETSAQGGAIRPRLILGDRRSIDTGNIGTDLTGITENRAVAGCNGDTDGHPTGCWNAGGGNWGNEKLFLGGSADITRGSWHLVEVFFEMNSISGGIGQTDGTLRYWLDGALVIDHSDVLFRTGANADMKFKQFMIAPYISDGSPVNQTMWVDDLQVANQR